MHTYMYIILLVIMTECMEAADPFLLHRAIKKGKVSTIQKRIREGCDVNAKNMRAKTPMYYAAGKANTYIIHILIQAGADVNSKNGFVIEKTPLHKAVIKNYVLNVRELLNNGAVITGQSKVLGCSLTPLHIATARMYSSIVLLLLNKGADPNARCATKNTPLHFARDLDSARFLICFGARLDLVNRLKQYPIEATDSSEARELLRATYQKNEHAIIALSGHHDNSVLYDGAQLSVIFDHVDTRHQKKILTKFALYAHFAHKNEFEKIVRMYYVSKKWLFGAVYCMHPKNVHILLQTQKQLRDNMCRIREKHTGHTLLHIAARYNRIRCFQSLLIYMSPILTNNYNETAYDIAKRYNRKIIGRMIHNWWNILITLQQPFMSHKGDAQKQKMWRLPPELASQIAQYCTF